jgi:hypothetical protein
MWRAGPAGSWSPSGGPARGPCRRWPAVVLADQGYQGAAHAKVPYKGKNKPQSQKEANKTHAKLRASGDLGERPAQDLADPPEALLLPWGTSHLAKVIHALEIRASRSMKNTQYMLLLRSELGENRQCSHSRNP